MAKRKDMKLKNLIIMFGLLYSCGEKLSITVISPTGEEIMKMGTTHEIIWESSHPDLEIKIELFHGGSVYQTISLSETNDGSYSWTIPSSYKEGTGYKIRVTYASDFTNYDESDAFFTLTGSDNREIIVTSPNGGEEWTIGSTQEITWSSTDVSGNVKIEFYQGGSAYQTISSSETNNGSYSWTIPSSYDAGTDYKVRISDVSDASVYDESDNNFTLTGGGTGTVTDIDGNVYQTVIIGNQEWMAENLKVTHYRDGSEIPLVSSYSEWSSLSMGAYAIYNGENSNADTYGYLYNWFAVDDSRNIAPEGWHVPTDEEWTVLSDYLGGTSVAGGKLKETGTSHWASPNTGATNETGFTALPAGYRKTNGNYNYINVNTYFRSSTAVRFLTYNHSSITRYDYDYYNNYGFSVRCIRD